MEAGAMVEIEVEVEVKVAVLLHRLVLHRLKELDIM